MAPARRERQTARGAAGQQRRGGLRAPSSARPRLTYRPGPAAAARGLQPHRGAASGAACVISARPSARGAQRTRVHFRPRPRGGSWLAGESAEGGGACALQLRPVELLPELVSQLYIGTASPPIWPCTVWHFFLSSLFGGEGGKFQRPVQSKTTHCATYFFPNTVPRDERKAQKYTIAWDLRPSGGSRQLNN